MDTDAFYHVSIQIAVSAKYPNMHRVEQRIYLNRLISSLFPNYIFSTTYNKGTLYYDIHGSTGSSEFIISKETMIQIIKERLEETNYVFHVNPQNNDVYRVQTIR